MTRPPATAPAAPPAASSSFYDPDLYDMQVGPGPRVADLYVPLALGEGGPVLELGCGTGAVLFPIARAGVSCTGIDNAPAMLERAAHKLEREAADVRGRLTLIAGDLTDVRLDRQFRQVFFSNDVIGHLLTNAELIAAFDRARAHLVPEGRLVLDVTCVDVAYLAQATDPWRNGHRYRGEVPIAGGDRIAVWERTEYCDATCRLSAHFRYEHIAGDGGVSRVYDRTLQLRPRHPEEIVLALRLSGFVHVDYARISRGAGDRAWLITARAPTGANADAR